MNMLSAGDHLFQSLDYMNQLHWLFVFSHSQQLSYTGQLISAIEDTLSSCTHRPCLYFVQASWETGSQVDSTKYKCKRPPSRTVIQLLKPLAEVVKEPFDHVLL